MRRWASAMAVRSPSNIFWLVASAMATHARPFCPNCATESNTKSKAGKEKQRAASAKASGNVCRFCFGLPHSNTVTCRSSGGGEKVFHVGHLRIPRMFFPLFIQRIYLPQQAGFHGFHQRLGRAAVLMRRSSNVSSSNRALLQRARDFHHREELPNDFALSTNHHFRTIRHRGPTDSLHRARPPA